MSFLDINHLYTIAKMSLHREVNINIETTMRLM
jgi:hypothetical protein